MTTKLVRAGTLTTRHDLVETGKRKREARKVCEVRQTGRIVTVCVRAGGVIATRIFDARDQVRVVANGGRVS